MILYLDASALIKRYVAEAGSEEVRRWIAEAAAVGTGIVARAEVSAAIARAVRLKYVSRKGARMALELFRGEWPDLVRLPVAEITVARADELAWEYGLHGYDALHLAMALIWQETVGEALTLATFDRELWQVGKRAGLKVEPRILG